MQKDGAVSAAAPRQPNEPADNHHQMDEREDRDQLCMDLDPSWKTGQDAEDDVHADSRGYN